MKVAELAQYKRILLDLRKKLVGNVTFMEDEALGKSRQDASGDLSNVPIHMADVGTDNYDRDLTIGLIQNGEEELKAIDNALERIGDKTYGSCEECGTKISKARLMALPYVRNCIECQRLEEGEE
ncbi:MAG: TraR/DksA family transcriptional regulator [Candidatus Scalindua rubra]|uniref:Transcriptional regulator n=1 Tax=Candidatus Scalindua brodae TaxID=237368 RepID=A0A0B0EI80_9BACT|nr:MAG: transcriptional regulator [Candidatus Scalindua brodae]MBZ0108377.1 TraR/DksA family transcriptional regulator [Candidatus Scalindua rubra]TWU34075.1 General stress protein 16O [Candidatus Brocadiaceae bacterium S225]